MRDNESRKWLYDNLTSNGYNVGKDYEEFDSLLTDNEESRKWVFETAQGLGYNVGKDYEEFDSLIAPVQPLLQAPKDGVEAMAVYEQKYNKGNAGNDAFAPEGEEIKPEQIVNGATPENKVPADWQAPEGATAAGFKPLNVDRVSLVNTPKLDVPKMGAEGVVEQSMQKMRDAVTPKTAIESAAENAKDATEREEVDSNAKDIVNTIIPGYEEERAKRKAQAANDAFALRGASSWGAMPLAMKQATEANKSDDIDLINEAMESLEAKIDANAEIKERVEAEAARLGVDKKTYIENVLKPTLSGELGDKWINSRIEAENNSPFRALSEAYKSSIIGMITSAGETDTDKYVSQAASQKFHEDAGLVEKALSGAASMFIDLPLFTVTGGLASVLAKAIGTNVVGSIVKRETAKLIAKSVAKEAAERYAKGVAMRTLKNRVLTSLATAPLQSGLTFGMFDAGKEMLRGTLNGDLSATGVLKSAVGGFGMGVGLGLVGVGGSALPLDMRGAQKIAAHTGLFALENAVFTEGGRLLQKWQGQEPTEDWMDSYVEGALTLGVIKLPGIAKGLRNMYSSKEAQDVFTLTRPEAESLKKYGEINDVIEAMLPRGEKEIKQSPIRGLLAGKTDERFAGMAEAKAEGLNNELLTETFTKVMLDADVPMSAKAKLVAIATGKMMPAPRVTHARVEDNRVVMLTPTGQIAEIREYSSPKEAHSEYNKMQHELEVSQVLTAEDMYIRMRAQEDDMNVIREWMEQNNVNAEEFSKVIARANAGEPLTKAEQKMIRSLQAAKRDAANDIKYLNELREDISLTTGEPITDAQMLNIMSKDAAVRTKEENEVMGRYMQKLNDYLRERYVQAEEKPNAEAQAPEAEPFEWYAEEGKMLGEAAKEPKKYKTAQEVESYVVPNVDGMTDAELAEVSKRMPAAMARPLNKYAKRKARYEEQKSVTDEMLQEALHDSELMWDAVENNGLVVEAVVDGKKVYVKKGNIAEENGNPVLVDEVLYVTEDGTKVEQIPAAKVEAVKIENATDVRSADRERVAKQVIEDRKQLIEGWKEFKRGETYDVLFDGENFELMIIARDENGDIVVSGDGGVNIAHMNEYVLQQGVIEAELAKQRGMAIQEFKDGVLQKASEPISAPKVEIKKEPVKRYAEGEGISVLLGDDVYNVTVKGYDEKGNVLVDVGFGVDEVYSEDALAKLQEDAKAQIAQKERLSLVESKIPRGKKGELLWESASPRAIAEYLRLKKPGDVTAQMQIVQGMIAGIEEQKKGMNPMEAIAIDDKIAFWNKVGAMLAPKVEQPQVEQPAVTSEIDALNVKFSPRLGVFNKMLENIRGIGDENLAAKRYAGLENMVADVEKELPEGYMVAVENGKYVIAKREEAPSQVVEPIEAPKNEIQEVKVEAEQTKEPVKEVAVAEIEEGQEVGPFGRIYRQFKGKTKEAIQFLLDKKEGEAVGALSHPEIGEIDLVWGEEGTSKSDGYGLAKLAKYHPEVLDDLQEIINSMRVTKRTVNRVQLENDTHQAAVRLTWDNESKTWLLTAFEKKNSAFDNTTDTDETPNGGKQNDTATLQNTVSTNEDTSRSANSQENAQKSGENAVAEGGNAPIVEKDVIDETRRQNEIAQEREKRAGEAPRPQVYADAIGSGDADAVKAWEDKFKGYLQKLVVDDLHAIKTTIESMQGLKNGIKAGNTQGYKDNSLYKAYDGIEKMLKNRKKELEKEVAPQGGEPVAASGYNVLPVEPIGKTEQLENGGRNALQNGTNELNLQQNDTDNEQREVGRVSESGDAIATLYDATSYMGRGNGAATQAGQSGGQKQSLLGALVQRAKENSSWIDDVQALTGNHITSGGENDVFLSKDGKSVIKINDFSYLPEDSENFNDFINRVQTHNELFPDVSLTIIGYTLNSEGKVSVVMKQPFVEAVREATDAEIDAFLEDMGFYTDITGNWTDGNVVIADAKPNNVLVDKNGVLSFIDVIPYDERKEGKMMRIPKDLNRAKTAENTPQIPENRTNPTEINGAVDMSTMQPVMGKDAFNELLKSGTKEEVNAYMKEIDHALRIGDNAPLDGKKVIQDDYRKAVEQYGKDNIPAEVITGLNARIEPYARLERELFDRKYALQERVKELDAQESAEVSERERVAKVEHKQTAFNGFLADKTDLGASAAEKALNKKYRFDGEVMTVAEFVERLLQDGVLKASTSEVSKYKGASRRAWNRMDAAQQKAEEERVKNGGTKTEYYVNEHNLGKTAYDYAQFLLAKAEQSKPAEVEQSAQGGSSEKPGNLQREKIEDVGEVLAGARKDMLKVIASAFDNATVQSLIELPFAKAFKKPDLKKAVESGVLREEDALFYETWFNTMINTSKPKLSRRVKSSDIEKWAQQNHDALQVLARFVESDEQARDVLVAEMLKDKYPNRETELAVIEKRKEWNAGSSTVWGDKTTPNPLWVMHEALKKLGAKPGEKLDIPFGVLKANTTGTGYELYNAKNERLVMQGVSSVEEGIEKIVWLAKLKRGDNVAHPMSAFNFKATKSEMVDSGRYRVMWGSGLNAQDRVFNSKEEAEQFAATRKSKTYIYPVQVPGRYYGYKITFRNPLTGDVVLADETAFETKGEAEQFLQENYDAINEKVNGELAKAKGESKKELSADDVLDIAMVYDNAWKYAVNIKKEYANNMGMPSMLREFNSRAEAKAYLDEVKEEIFKGVKKAIEDKKAFVYFDTGENSRIGEDYRGGKDVTAEDFMNEFGFRGVQFGNWTNQADRQMAVNQAYDAFLDLAKLIGVSPKALSLNGELGIAFGSRGSGKFAAHYEPGEIVINLTKTRGAGSLAHEWWHALDNYFARRADVPGGMVTDSKNLQMREELREAYNALLRQIENSDYMQRSVSQGDYWGRMHEVTARLLAEWVDQSLKKNGEVNTFLSRGVNEDEYKRMNYEGYTIAMKAIGEKPMPYEEFAKTDKALAGFPYPTKEEVQEFGDAMRNVFDVMQEDATDDGKVALFSIAANTMAADMGTEAFERATERTVEQLKGIVPVEIATPEQAREMMGLAEMQKRTAPETASVQEEHQPTVVSSADGAKVLKDLDTAIKEYENKSSHPKTLLGDIAKLLNAKKHGSNSQYATFEAVNGKVFTIRLANHNAKVSTFDNHNEDEGISIVVTAQENNGVTNDGNAHLVEFFYDAIKLRKADGKPLVEILKSIKQALYSGEYKDNTGLAQVEEVNIPEMMTVYHGSGAKFDKFDHSFIGTGTGYQVYGWAQNGEVTLTPAGLNPDTPVHEYTHLWADAVKESAPELWSEIVEGMKASGVWNEVARDENYRNIWNNENRMASEVLSRLTGRENYRREMERAREEIRKAQNPIEAAEKVTAWERVKRALQAFWEKVKSLMGLPVKGEPKSDVPSWMEFVEMPLKDFWKGVKPDAKGREVEMMGSRVDARMAEVAARFDGKELSPEKRAVVDVFGGKADNVTISVKTGGGNERKIVMRQGNEMGAGAKHSLFRHYGMNNGAITADDVLLIPEVLANGERTENGKKTVYKYSTDGVEYTVITEINNRKDEVFTNFYTNRKASSTTRKTRSEEARDNADNAFEDKGSNISSNVQEGAEFAIGDDVSEGPVQQPGEPTWKFKARKEQWQRWVNSQVVEKSPMPVAPEMKRGESAQDYEGRVKDFFNDLNKWSKEIDRKDSEIERMMNVLYDGKPIPKTEAQEFTERVFKSLGGRMDVSLRDVRGYIKDEIINRRKMIESNNLEDVLFIDKIRSMTTTEERKAIPFIIEGTYGKPVDIDLMPLATGIKTIFTKEQQKQLPAMIDGTYSGGLSKAQSANIEELRRLPEDKRNNVIRFITEGSTQIDISPELRQVVVSVREWFERVYQMLQAGDAMHSSQKIQNYVTHIWDKQRTPKKIYETYINTHSKYTNKRSIETYAEGIAMGMVPKYDDICDIMLEYGHVANEALGNKYFIDFLQLLDVDGSPVLKDVDARDPLYVKINSNVLEKYKVHKNAKKLVECVLGSADSRDIPIFSALARRYDLMGSAMKRINLSCSFFHHGALTETGVALLREDFFPVVFKNIIWDSLRSGKAPALNNPEAARRAVKHLVQLGATADYVAKETGRYTEKLKRWAEDLRDEHKNAGTQVVAGITEFIDFLNDGNDKFLWDFLHDGLKIYSFEKLARDIDTMCKKKGITGVEKDMLLDEAGQFVNDTFGGQFWELIDVTPEMLKWLRRGFLSPDWFVSTSRQFLSVFGYGALYADYNQKWWQKPFGWTTNENGRTFSEKYMHSSEAVKMRRRMGVGFWVTAAITFSSVINMLNAWRRAQDVDKELEKAEEKRKTDPTYKSPYELKYPDGMKWYDYTMLGNSTGHQTHLFWGRYDDESEMYVRWGKQFREFFELFLDNSAFVFPGPMIKKLLGKANPALQGLLAFCGYTLDGYESKYMKNKKGWEKELGRVMEISTRMLPYVVPVGTDKSWEWLDLFLPTSRGMSKYKAIDYYKTAIMSGDMSSVERVYDACVLNHLNAEQLLKTAIASVEAEARKQRVEGVETLNDAWEKYNGSDVPEKKAIRKWTMRALEEDRYKDFEKEEAVKAVSDFLETGELNPNKQLPDIYIANEEINDVRDDFKVAKIRLATKKIKEQGDAITDEHAWKEFKEKYGAKLDLYKDVNAAGRVISQIKEEMETNPQDAQVLMQEIRDIRRYIINFADSIDVKVTLTDKESNKEVNM